VEEWVRAEQEKERDEWEMYRAAKFFIERYGILAYHDLIVELHSDMEKERGTMYRADAAA